MVRRRGVHCKPQRKCAPASPASKIGRSLRAADRIEFLQANNLFSTMTAAKSLTDQFDGPRDFQ
jgi:hypothetical protein